MRHRRSLYVFLFAVSALLAASDAVEVLRYNPNGEPNREPVALTPATWDDTALWRADNAQLGQKGVLTATLFCCSLTLLMALFHVGATNYAVTQAEDAVNSISKATVEGWRRRRAVTCLFVLSAIWSLIVCVPEQYLFPSQGSLLFDMLSDCAVFAALGFVFLIRFAKEKWIHFEWFSPMAVAVGTLLVGAAFGGVPNANALVLGTPGAAEAAFYLFVPVFYVGIQCV